MRKVISASSAVALGLVGATSPSMAATALSTTAQPCALQSESTVTDLMDNWYQTCIPQYGIGKVEFTISSSVDFPADFKDLSDASVGVTTPADVNALNTYFSVSPGEEFAGPFRGLHRVDDGTNSKLQRYEVGNFFSTPMGVSAFKVATATEVTSADVPSYCSDNWGNNFVRVFKVTFEPLDVMFTQTVDGEEWSYHIVMTPDTEYIAGTLGSFDWDGNYPMCMVQGEFANGGPGTGDSAFDAARVQAAMVNPYPGFNGFFTGQGAFVSDYPRYFAPVELPATGVEPALPLGLGATLLLAGGLAVAIRRRRA